MELNGYIERQIAFSRETFGPGKRTGGVLEHIRKELKEIEAKPDDITEWSDLLILALDGAWRQGFTAVEICAALQAKQDVNRARQWPDWREVSEDSAIEHIRSADD